MITSCLECRRRKLKCNKSYPCSNCSKVGRDCVFLAPALDQASQLKLTEIKEKVGSLERLLERDAVQAKAKGTRGQEHSDEDADAHLIVPDDEQELEPSPMVTQDATYDFGGAEDDDLLDLGIQMGKMRVTDRVGGLQRPKILEEVSSLACIVGFVSFGGVISWPTLLSICLIITACKSQSDYHIMLTFPASLCGSSSSPRSRCLGWAHQEHLAAVDEARPSIRRTIVQLLPWPQSESGHPRGLSAFSTGR